MSEQRGTPSHSGRIPAALSVRAATLIFLVQFGALGALGAWWFTTHRDGGTPAPTVVHVHVHSLSETARQDAAVNTTRERFPVASRRLQIEHSPDHLVRELLDSILFSRLAGPVESTWRHTATWGGARSGMSEWGRYLQSDIGRQGPPAMREAFMNGTVLSEVPAELQPLFDALHDLRPHFDLNEFAADPGLLDTLGLALNDAQGFLARLQGTRRGAGAGLDESLAPLLDVLSMTENILARFEDGVLRDFAPGEHFDGFERESGFSLERRRALLFLMLMLNNRDGHAEKAKFQQNGFGYATGQDERVSTGKAWSLSAR